jgi:hypothetical protein
MEPIVNFFKQYVFGEKLDVLDDREPVWSFDVMGKNFELLPPSLSFWKQMTAVSCNVEGSLPSNLLFDQFLYTANDTEGSNNHRMILF